MRDDRRGWLLIATSVAFLAHGVPVAAQAVPDKPGTAAAGEPGIRGGDPSEFANIPEIYPFVPAPFASAALSPDGNWIAAGTSDWTKPGDLLLWDVATRTLKFQLHFNQGVSTVAFSPDNSWLAAGSLTGELVLVDVPRAKLVARWTPHTGSVQGMVFSPDSKLLASPSIDKSVKLWNVVPPADSKTGLPLRLMFDAHTDGVLTAAFAPDGKRLYTGCRDQKVFVWDLQKPRKLAVWGKIPTAVQHMAVAPDGESVALGLLTGAIQIRQPTDGTVIHTLEHSEGRVFISKVCFARKSPLVATAAGDGTVKIWELPEGTLRTTIRAHSGRACAAELTADGGQVLTAGIDGLVRMWDAGTNKEIFQVRADAGILETESPLVASAWSRDRSVLATVHTDDSIRLRDPTTGHTLKMGAAPVEMLAAWALSPDGRRLAGAGEDRALYVWDVSGEFGAPVVLRGHAGRVTGVVFAPDGKSVFSSSTDGTVRQWEAASGSPGLVLDARKDKLLCLACADDGRWLAAGGRGGSVHLWNLATPTTGPATGPATAPAMSLGGHSGAVTALAFDSDRSRLASAGDDKFVFLWNLAGLEQDGRAARPVAIRPRLLYGHQEPVQSLAFSPRGKWLATASLDKTIRLWATELGSSAQMLYTTPFIQSLAFHPDDGRLSGVGSDRTLAVWRAGNGISFAAKEGRYVKLRALSEVNGHVWTTVGEFRVFEGQDLVPTGQWKVVSADSEESDTPAAFAFDGNPRTFWGTRWRANATGHPHEIVIDLGEAHRLTGFSVLPRNDGIPNGTIKDYEFYVGNDLKNFGPPVSQGQLGAGGAASP